MKNKILILIFVLIFQFFAISNSEAKSTHNELENIAEEIESETEDLEDEVKDYLKDEDRWEPAGVDFDLWETLKDFHSQSIRIEAYLEKKETLVTLETKVARLLRRGEDIDRLLVQTGSNKKMDKHWENVNESLDQFRMRFYGESDLDEDEFEEDDGTARYFLKRVRRFSKADEDQIKELTRKLIRQAATIEYEFEVNEDILDFRASVQDMQSAFQRNSNKMKIKPEVRSVLRFGKNLNKLAEGPDPDPAFNFIWEKTKENLNILATIFKLEKI